MYKLKAYITTHPYCLLVLYFIPYCFYFLLIENFLEPILWISTPLDNLIPFNEWFIIPYFLWFPYMAFSLSYFLYKDKEEFVDLCTFMFLGMSIALFIQTIIPNGLDLRVHVEGNNLLCDIARLLYTIDTPTNVCPSIHVASSLAIALAILRSKKAITNKGIKFISTLLLIFICISTMVLKQHSIIDVGCGIGLSGLLYFAIYHYDYRKIMMRTPLKHLYK